MVQIISSLDCHPSKHFSCRPNPQLRIYDVDEFPSRTLRGGVLACLQNGLVETYSVCFFRQRVYYGCIKGPTRFLLWEVNIERNISRCVVLWLVWISFRSPRTTKRDTEQWVHFLKAESKHWDVFEILEFAKRRLWRKWLNEFITSNWLAKSKRKFLFREKAYKKGGKGTSWGVEKGIKMMSVSWLI